VKKQDVDRKELETGAQAIRDAIAVYRGLNAVADMMEALEPLEEAESILRARVVEVEKDLAEKTTQVAGFRARLNSARTEYEKSMELFARCQEVRERDFEAELEAKHADRVAAVAALDAEIAAKTEHHRSVTEQVEKLRRLFV
jgi:SMC interacting uncharacterized protein involved in chromosome segregation